MFTGMGKPDFIEGRLTLEPGDTLVLVTDGITESRKVGELDQYGPEGIANCLSANSGASAEQIAAGILGDASSFADGALRDDAVVVVIRKLNDTKSGAIAKQDITRSCRALKTDKHVAPRIGAAVPALLK